MLPPGGNCTELRALYCPLWGSVSVSTRQKRKSRFSGFVVPGICLCLLAYFAHHAQTGRFSIHTHGEMEEERMRLAYELADLKLQRRELEQRISLLSDGTMERDALDEQARRQLGYAAAGEVVIFTNHR